MQFTIKHVVLSLMTLIPSFAIAQHDNYDSGLETLARRDFIDPLELEGRDAEGEADAQDLHGSFYHLSARAIYIQAEKRDAELTRRFMEIRSNDPIIKVQDYMANSSGALRSRAILEGRAGKAKGKGKGKNHAVPCHHKACLNDDRCVDL